MLNKIPCKSWYDRIGTLPHVKFWKTSLCGRRDVNYEFIFNSLEDRNYQILITLDFMQMARAQLNNISLMLKQAESLLPTYAPLQLHKL